MATKTHALVAEFDTPEALMAAAEKTRDAGYKEIDAYSPFPIHGMGDAIGFGRPILPWVIFAGGLAGLGLGFALEYWVSVINNPINVGGRPMNSWPSFVPIMFETTVLIAALTTVFGMLAFNGLPRHYHPIFNHPRFERASQDLFFLAVESKDPKFDPVETRTFLEGLAPAEVVEVEDE